MRRGLSPEEFPSQLNSAAEDRTPNALQDNRLWSNHQIGEEEGCRPIKSHYPRHGLERGNKRHTRSKAGEAPCSLSAGAVPWGTPLKKSP